MSRRSEPTIGLALVIAMGCGVSNAAAQTDKYPTMIAIGQYLMEKNAEIRATRRSWFWDGRDARQPLKARTGLSAWWKEVGWLRSTGPKFWNPKVRAAG